MVFSVRQQKTMQPEEGMRRRTKIIAVVSFLCTFIVGYYLFSYSRDNMRLKNKNIDLNINLRKYAAGYTKCVKNLDTSKQDAMNFHEANKALQTKVVKQEQDLSDSVKNNADLSMKLDYAYQFFLDVKDLITGDQSISLDKLVLPETSSGLISQIHVFKTEHSELEKLRAAHDETTQALDTLRTSHADLSATSGGLEARAKKLMKNNRLLKKQLRMKKEKVQQKTKVIDALEQTIQSLEEDIKNLKNPAQSTSEPAAHETETQERQSENPEEHVVKSPQENVEKRPQENVEKSPQENVEESPEENIKKEVEEVPEKAPETNPDKDTAKSPEIPSQEQVEKVPEENAEAVAGPVPGKKVEDTSEKRLLESLEMTPEQMLAKSLANVIQAPGDSLEKNGNESPGIILPEEIAKSSEELEKLDDTPSERRVAEQLGAVSETINAPPNPPSNPDEIPNTIHEQIKNLDVLASDVAASKVEPPQDTVEDESAKEAERMSDEEADEDDLDEDPLSQK